MKRAVLATVVISMLCGCSAIQRVPQSAIKEKYVIYLTQSDRIPREVIGATTAGVEAASATGDAIAKIVGELGKEGIGAYRDVERNTASRSVEVFVSGYEAISGTEINAIVETFQEITRQQFPTK